MNIPSMLISLPDGLNVSGVTMWGVRLANGLAARGVGAGLIVHAEPEGHRRLEVPIDPRVMIVDATSLPRCGEGCDVQRWVELYRAAATRMVQAFGAPVVLSPNLHEDSYTACDRVRLELGPMARMVGWAHSDNAYDVKLLARFAPALSACVGVSEHICAQLRDEVGQVTPVANIPYGVEVPQMPPARSGEGPLRLVYAGRLEHRQKRVLALPTLSKVLRERGVQHQLSIGGDGPAEQELRQALSGLDSVTCLGAVPPTQMMALLCRHDAFVLPSRYEGLSVSMLEALACGCVPVVARVESGLAQAVRSGYNGVVVDVPTDANEQTVGERMARVIAELPREQLAQMSINAWRTAAELFSLPAHVFRVLSLLNDTWSAPARLGGLCSASLPATVPVGATQRIANLASLLTGRPVVVHGVGAHTKATRPAWAGMNIVAFTDDDRAVQGTSLWGVPVIAPEQAAQTGARDVIISSWLHQGSIWTRREVYERQGMAVHKLYTDTTQAA